MTLKTAQTHMNTGFLYLKNAAGVLAKMSRNEFVLLGSLCKICSELVCDIGDVMEFIKNEHA